ncbi:MAG TPA: BadF/BadG/BcrA/BcrD ATPase family protein, partial [Candidatus Baltobacteraceae bacterium]|nr:BadF/BadG/BcrA/BcrD ATPase family protein [Candidatus Baltobacteraceae bacterium]
MTQRLLAGIDGGQSSTTAAIGDCGGRVLGRGSAGPADEIGEGANSSRLRDALRGALTAACDRAGLDRDTHFDTIVAGVSGYEGRVYGRAAELPAARVLFMHDAPVAHAGALGGHPGIVAIAGTGSVVYGTDGKRAWTLGGWGHLFGDEGSAFWFAREALSRLMCSQDAGDASNAPERDAACAFFAQPSLRHLAR